MGENIEHTIAVSIVGHTKAFQASLMSASKRVAKLVNDMRGLSKQFNELNKTNLDGRIRFKELVKNQLEYMSVMKEARAASKIYQKQLDNSYKTVMVLNRATVAQKFNVNSYLKSISTPLGMFKADFKVLEGRLLKFANSFQYWGLSIMFFGMQMQRIFTNIARAGVSAFTKVMESSGYFGSAIQQLGVHWEYLKFTIGSTISRALEPIMPIIINIVNNIAKWIREHPKLTAVLVLGGAALGTFLTTIGQIAVTLGPLVRMLSLGPGGLGGALLGIAGISIGTLGLVALEKTISKNKKVADDLKKSFNTLLDNLKKKLKTITEVVMPNAENEWEAIGYTVAWFGKIAIGIIDQVVARVSGLIIWFYRLRNAFEYAVGEKSELEALLTKKKLEKKLEEVAKNTISLGELWNLVSMGPSGYMELMKKVETPESILKIKEEPTQPSVTRGLGSQGVGIYIENVRVPSTNAEQFVSDLLSYSTGG